MLTHYQGWIRRAALAVLAGWLNGGLAQSPAERQPVYPVFGILGVDPAAQGKVSLPGAALKQLSQYQMIYTSDGPALREVRDGRKAAGAKTPVIVYMGGFTTNPGGATEIEKGFRQAVAMIDVATLAEGIDERAAQVRVEAPKGSELAIKASTADLSDPDNKAKYCFWIRVDGELMKVLAVDAKSGGLKVQRGFESKAAAHAKGAVVLTPVYLGNRNQLDAYRHSNSWPGGPDYLRYALDPASEAAQQYKANLIADLMKAGYDGAWLDTFQPVPYNLCDALGRKVNYFWDFKGQRRYELESYMSSLQVFLRGVRQKVKAAAGKEPVLAANSVSGSYALGSKQLFAAPDRPDLLDGGYCFEDSFISPKNAGGKKGKKLQASFSPAKPEHWLRNVENEADAARSGLRALCMMGPAGYVAAYINPALENYPELLQFSWCSFLLTVTKERTTWFGLPLLVTQKGGQGGFLPLSEMFYAKLGDPLDGNEPAKLKQGSGPCYVRKFQGGLVAVNPATSAGKVEVPAGYVDWETKQAVRQLDLPPGTGRLLVKP